LGKKKLLKFSQLATFANTYQNHQIQEPLLTDYQGEKLNMKGKWDAHHFKNGQPITLELACGGGEYTLQLARMHVNRNFIGVDIKGNRIWKGARVALAENLDNAAFARFRIEKIEEFFDKAEINEIWITFADPFLKKPNRRLTGPRFLERYRQILTPGGVVHLKTDSDELYDYTLSIIKEEGLTIEYQNADIYSGALVLPELEFKTYYERMHLENKKTIKYVRFVP